MYQNYPNPFNPKTLIKFCISKISNSSGDESFVKLSIYNSIGQLMDVLVNKKLKPGEYEIEFNAESDNYPSGIYYAMLNYGHKLQTKKLVLIK
jgi:hypothetical protein